MRLIDADALIENIGKIVPSTDYYEFASQICNAIRNQPTAYDVEKVIEDLSSNSRFIDDINEHNIKCISCVIGQKTAIDIVKAGGVE